jgi:hypothetical protein
MKNILITFPNKNWVHKEVFLTGLKLAADKRYNLEITMPTFNPFENGLHHTVNEFVGGNYDYWLCINADNPPLANPLDLVELDKDIIGCPTPIYHFNNKTEGERPWYENVYEYVSETGRYKEWPIKKGLQKVDAIGTGCFLIARRVFDHPEMRKGAFNRKLNPDGTVHKGNDISFSERAIENGFEIYAHFDYRCRHYKEIDLYGVINAFQGIRING